MQAPTHPYLAGVLLWGLHTLERSKCRWKRLITKQARATFLIRISMTRPLADLIQEEMLSDWKTWRNDMPCKLASRYINGARATSLSTAYKSWTLHLSAAPVNGWGMDTLSSGTWASSCGRWRDGRTDGDAGDTPKAERQGGIPCSHSKTP